MIVLHPSFLWLIIPLILFLWKGSSNIMQRVHFIILILIVIALSRPVQEKALQEASTKAKDIIIALDVSYSMKATDISPTRYDFAKRTITALLGISPSDNIMLIAFTTNPLLLSPPTTDHTLIKIALQSLNPEFILTKGTSLKKLFQKLSKMKMGHKNLILITDGGEEDNLNSLTTLVQESTIDLIILALGTLQGTTLEAQNGTLLKDKEGKLVISRINPLLESLASAVNGRYITPSLTVETTANELSRILEENEAEAHKVQKIQRHYRELYQVPLALALLLFLMVHTSAVKYLFILFALLGIPSQATLFDNYHLMQAYKSYQKSDFNSTHAQIKKIQHPSLQSQATLANTYYKQRAFKKSIGLYKSIRSTSSCVKQMLYYNIANAYVMLASYDKAKIYYTKTLQLGKDADAAHNLQLVVLLSAKKDAKLGIAHPKSQDSSSSKSDSQEEEKKEENRSEDDPSSGSSGGGKSQTQKEQPKEKEKQQLISDGEEEKHPLSSKVYELINKGYIREKQPW